MHSCPNFMIHATTQTNEAILYFMLCIKLPLRTQEKLHTCEYRIGRTPSSSKLLRDRTVRLLFKSVVGTIEYYVTSHVDHITCRHYPIKAAELLKKPKHNLKYSHHGLEQQAEGATSTMMVSIQSHIHR